MPQALYDLQSDLSESIDVAKQNPHIVADLERLAEIARADLGDDLTRRTPSGTRPVGRVD